MFDEPLAFHSTSTRDQMVCVKEYTKTYEEMLTCGWLERFGYREITLAKTNAISHVTPFHCAQGTSFFVL
jgi:hypothetical protein